MNWIKKNVSWLGATLGILVLVGGFAATIARLEAHAATAGKHLTRQALQQEYVPRPELERTQEGIDDKFEAQDKKLDDIHGDVKDIQRMLMEGR